MQIEVLSTNVQNYSFSFLMQCKPISLHLIWLEIIRVNLAGSTYAVTLSSFRMTFNSIHSMKSKIAT